MSEGRSSSELVPAPQKKRAQPPLPDFQNQESGCECLTETNVRKRATCTKDSKSGLPWKMPNVREPTVLKQKGRTVNSSQ